MGHPASFLHLPRRGGTADHSHNQYVIRNIALVAFNVAKHSKGRSPSTEVSKALFDAADKPLWQKPPTKRRAIDNPAPESKKSKKRSSIETPERTTSPKHTTSLEQTTSRRTQRANLYVVEADSTSDRTIAKTITLPLTRVSPSGRVNDWLQTWMSIIKSIPPNPKTGKAAVWPTLLTKVLVHAFGYDGVNNVITMAKQVLNNYDMFTIDATTSADGDVNSPVRSLAIRLKTVWASSRGSAITKADAICY
jgi:hypothetical protein